MISFVIIKIFEFDISNALIECKLRLLTDWTCKQSIANEFFAQSDMFNYLLSIIFSNSTDPFFNYRCLAVLSLYNIMFDSINMQRMFIESQSIQKVTDIFYNATDPSDNILSELMKVISIITENVYQLADMIDENYFNDFICRSTFRITNVCVYNAEKYDYYVFLNFISMGKDKLYFLIQELINSQFKNIFDQIEKYEKKNIINILTLLLDIFIIFVKEGYDPSILSNLIDLKELYQIFCYIQTLNIDEDLVDAKIIYLLFTFTHYFFHFCTTEIKNNNKNKNFFDKSVYNSFLQYLSAGSYKIRFSVFKAIESMLSINETNKEAFIDRITSDFFLSLIDLLDSESSEFIESIVKLIFDLLHNKDERDTIRVVRKMKEANDAFIVIEELKHSEELTEDALAYCNEIMNHNDCVVFYCDTREFDDYDNDDCFIIPKDEIEDFEKESDDNGNDDNFIEQKDEIEDFKKEFDDNGNDDDFIEQKDEIEDFKKESDDNDGDLVLQKDEIEDYKLDFEDDNDDDFLALKDEIEDFQLDFDDDDDDDGDDDFLVEKAEIEGYC